MVKPVFEVKKLGQYPRRYDEVTEDTGEENDKRIVADLLQWMEVKSQVTPPHQSKKKEDDILEMVEAGVALGNLDKVAAISTLQSAALHGPTRKGLRKLLHNIYYGTKDLLSGRRVKSSLTVLGGIAAGAALGAVLGTVVFPGIGTAVGGTLGAVGGAIILGIAGGVVGSWIARKISKKAYPDERDYEVSKSKTTPIKKKYGIKHHTVQLMNAYLHNRSQAVKSPLCQHYYTLLRKNAIRKADNDAMQKLAHFFCQELSMLNLELGADSDNQALQEDKRAVLYILRQLKNAEGLPLATRRRVEEALNTQKVNRRTPAQRISSEFEESPLLSASRELPVERAAPVRSVKPRESMTQINEHFVENLRGSRLEIKEVEAEHHRPESLNHSYYRYHVTRHNKPDLPDIIFRERKVSDNVYSREMMVEKAQITAENQDEVSEELVAMAKAVYAASGNKSLKVVAAKDEELAVRFMAAALVANCTPYLDETEFPDEAQRKGIEKKAYQIARVSPPEERVHVGFRVEKRGS
ncbi:MAG: hypothetical protein AB7I18_02640 [Candidatus Berkiella sp.]